MLAVARYSRAAVCTRCTSTKLSAPPARSTVTQLGPSRYCHWLGPTLTDPVGSVAAVPELSPAGSLHAGAPSVAARAGRWREPGRSWALPPTEPRHLVPGAMGRGRLCSARTPITVPLSHQDVARAPAPQLTTPSGSAQRVPRSVCGSAPSHDSTCRDHTAWRERRDTASVQLHLCSRPQIGPRARAHQPRSSAGTAGSSTRCSAARCRRRGRLGTPSNCQALPFELGLQCGDLLAQLEQL